MHGHDWIISTVLAATLVAPSFATAQPGRPAAIPGHIALADGSGIPESLTVTNDGTIIVGSADKGILLRAAPGESIALPWVTLTSTDPVTVLGVLADDRRRILWVCSFELPAGAAMSQRRFALRTFDLKSGAVKALYPSPGCNDVAIGADGTAYITDTENTRILRLTPGSSKVEPWFQEAQLQRPNGITFVDGKLYVGASNTLNRIDVRSDGSASGLTPLQMERPLRAADGIRTAGPGRALVAEMGSPLIKDGAIGQATLVTISGGHATLQTLGRGYQSPTAIAAANADTALILESKLPYWWDPEIKGKDPGQVHIFALRIPR